MRLTMRMQISGTRNGRPWPAQGDVIDIDDTVEADALIAAGIATPEDEPAEARPSAPKTGTVDAIKAEVGDDLDKAVAALEAELAQAKPRKSLVEHLTGIIEAVDADAGDEAEDATAEGGDGDD